MCGEKFEGSCREMVVTGSPPHVRGKADFAARIRDEHRITPACAGKSWKGKGKTMKKKDHPRMCGEK